MVNLLVNVIGSLVGTVLLYFLCKRIYNRYGKKLFLKPLLMVPVIIGSFLEAAGISYDTYVEGSQYISMMLQPATVAFAVPLYRFRRLAKKYAVPLITVIGMGCFIAFMSSLKLAELLGLGPELAHSIAPRSVTTPMAMSASNILGGDPTITAVLVIATGLIGMVSTSLYIKRAKIHNHLLKGMLYGISAHGTGTAKAYEDGQKTGTIASLSMIFMGLFTTFIAPIVALFDI